MERLGHELGFVDKVSSSNQGNHISQLTQHSPSYGFGQV